MPIVGTTKVVNGQEVTILVEVDEVPQDAARDPWQGADSWDVETRSGRAEKVMDAARDLFGDGLALARDCAARAVATIDSTEREIRPHDFELQLAIKLDAQAGAVLTKVGAGAQMQVTMRWRTSREP